MSRLMYRYAVPVDNRPHQYALSSDPVAVAAIRNGHRHIVEFWAEHEEGDGAPDQEVRTFRVYGSGHVLPDDARWSGTCPRTPEGLVWHLYEVKP